MSIHTYFHLLAALQLSPASLEAAEGATGESNGSVVRQSSISLLGGTRLS